MSLEAALAPVATPPAASPTAGAPPGSSPPSGAPPFHSALAEHWARTAQAEGQSQGDSSSSLHQRSTAAGDDAQAGEAGLIAASLEGQSVVHDSLKGKTAAVAAKAGAEASGAGSATLFADGSSRAALTPATSPAGASSRTHSSGPGGEPTGTLAEAGKEASGSTVGSELEGPPASGEEAEVPAGSAPASGKSALVDEFAPIYEAPSGAASLPVTGPVRQAGARNARGTSASDLPAPVEGTGQVAATSSAGSAGFTQPVSEAVKAPSAELPVSAAAEGTTAGEASLSGAGREQRTNYARAPRPGSAAGGVGGIDVARSSKGSKLVAGPLGHAGSSAGNGLAGAVGEPVTPGTVAAEADSLLTSAMGVQASANGASATAAPVTAAGVGMQDMIDSIRATIELAARQGAAQARIALHPQELGHISIRLSQTGDGLLARVNADTTAGAQALAGGRAELHQTLSTLGVTLLRLDIGSFAQSQTGEQEQSAGGQGGSEGSGEAEGPDDAEGAQASTPTTSLAGTGAGELVDVLA